jgi:hypothetical protein
MNLNKLSSDQSYMWSAQDDRRTCFRPQTSPQTAAAPSAPTGVHPAGLTHRALQTLRQARLQMCRRPRTRSQVLSLGELPGQSAANGLRPSGRSARDQRTRRQLSSGARDLGADLRDQPRTPAASRNALRRSGEPGSNVAHPPHRFPVGRRTPRQHAHGLVRRRARVAAADRGDRR